ncbi:iron complex outermembrane receptor protein [Sphingopyxis panaciterrae]|uniref:TonB-dependent receptor n=1 Tax=Sphingopyxis panaciterrae TaxID=363841 RepID=UPI00142143DB|nr:TonB-dependent receptor [Sphingopyxis panaciterrae]NIJ37542.1 iron complex outermembrane receptor protein [Sphingopyxis panaciterrae]
MRAIVFTLVGIAALTLTPPSWAQEQEKPGSPEQPSAPSSSSENPDVRGGLSDIVVTAQRREQSLQSVPIAVQAFSGERLQASGIENTADLAMVTPGLVVVRGVGLSSPFLRGIGSSSNGPGVESPVATYVDGVYYGSKATAMGSLANVERVEVLKGPQGTLFGRNATGGLIQIITRDPSSTPGFTAKAGYQNYATVTASGYVTGGLAQDVSADLALDYRNQGKGWGFNTVTGTDVNVSDSFLARSKILIEPGPDTRIVLSGDYGEWDSDTGLATRFADGFLGSNGQPYVGPRYGVQASFDQFFRSRAGGVSLTATHSFDDITLTSITAYRRSNYAFAFDGDGTAAPVLRFETAVHERQFSQELQLSGGSPDALEWTAGAYFFDANGRQSVLFSGTSFPTLITRAVYGAQSTRAYAGYAQGTYSVAEGTRITLGARYNSEKRGLSGDVILTALDGTVTRPTIVPDGTDATFNKLTWRVAVDHDLAEDVLAYASYNRGFRSGGYNPSNLTNPPFRPEVLDAYELGFKSSLFDRRLRLNIAAFFYDFRDIQLSQFVLGVQTVRNAARAEVYGLDVDFEALVTERLRLSGSFEYLKGEYKSFPGAAFAVPLPAGGNAVVIGDAAGKELIRSPRVTGNVAVDYSLPLQSGLTADFNVTYTYNDGFFWEPDNYLFQKSYSLVNARASISFDDHHKISVWGRNLANKYYATTASAASVGTVASPGEPRTYGVTLETKF